MRILHLIPHLSGGGAERQLGYLAPEMARMGYGVHIAYSMEGPQKPKMPGVVLHPLKAQSNYNPLLIWQLVRLIRCVKPDILHTWILKMDILGGMAARITGVPWIFREPSSVLAYPPTWKNRLRVRIASGASAIVSNSLGGDAYWNTRLPRSRRYIISNGLPVGEIDGTPAALPPGMAAPDVPIVLNAGRLASDVSAAKNLDVLIKVLAFVCKQQEVLGVLCGDGPQRSELELLTHKLELDGNVHFAGHLPALSVWALMKKAAVFVSLSAYEGCPNTVMEAMACGCPLVLSDIPAHREICDESCALFVDPSNIQDVAGKVMQVLNNPDDTKKRVLRARQKTHLWIISEMTRNWESVYKETLFRFTAAGI